MRDLMCFLLCCGIRLYIAWRKLSLCLLLHGWRCSRPLFSAEVEKCTGALYIRREITVHSTRILNVLTATLSCPGDSGFERLRDNCMPNCQQ
jgi:hypothetical protein